jgi:hypothetical protein
MLGMGVGSGNRMATVSGVALADEDALPEHRDRLLHGPERASSVDLNTVRGYGHVSSRYTTARTSTSS